jgi:hypothetical protein
MAEFQISGSSAKQPETSVLNSTKCVFCGNGFTATNASSSPSLKKIESLFEACKKRQCKVSCKILENRDKILNGTVTLHYHRNCRATFGSVQHIKRLDRKRTKSASPPCEDETLIPPQQIYRRSMSPCNTFSWKENCFVCGKYCNPKHSKTWSLVETAIDAYTLECFKLHLTGRIMTCKYA